MQVRAVRGTLIGWLVALACLFGPMASFDLEELELPVSPGWEEAEGLDLDWMAYQ